MGLPQEAAQSRAIDLDGLEGVFVTVPGTATSTPPNIPANDAGLTTTVPTTWSLKEAAHNLGVSVNTVRNRIKSRELHGFKAPGPNGPEWRITPPTETQPMAAGVSTLLQVIETQVRQIEVMSKQIESNANQLKAAAEVVTYMHEQLRTKDEQLKLLTDSQHKTSWWRRLSSWAMGK